MGSILNETKQSLGLAVDAVGYDPELILFINSVLSDMTQLGVGPDSGFAITNGTPTWDDFMGSDPRLNSAKTYMYLSVKMLFNPSQIGFVLSAMEKLRDEAAWRLTVKASDAATELVGGRTKITGNVGDEQVILLTNPTGETLINSSGLYEATFTPLNGSTRIVPLDASDVANGNLSLPIIVETGTYVVRLLSPRRTILTVEVLAV